MSTKALGIDLSDTNTNLVFSGIDGVLSFPTTICREKGKDEWFVGEDAYKKLLKGDGVIIDKLLSLTIRKGTATIDNVKYKGKEILKKFFQTIIDRVVSKYSIGYPEEIVISIPKLDSNIVDQVMSCFVELGYIKSHIHVISRCESFICYTMKQKKEIWNNQVGLFYLSDHELTYYELKVTQGYRNVTVMANSWDGDTNFDTNVLRTPTGAKVGDQILFALAQKMIQKRLFSSILLAGRGFENLNDWAINFKSFVCHSNRKVFYEKNLFAIGACNKAVDLMNQVNNQGFTCICDGRLSTTVYINIVKNSKELEVPLAKAGDSWYTLTKEMRVIADSETGIEISVLPINEKSKKKIKIPLDFIPKRPDRMKKTMRVDLKTAFKDSRTMIIDIKDAGFGDIIESSKAHLVKEVDLWD